MSNLFIQESVNLFCGDHDPTKSKFLSLAELTLPNLAEMTEDHLPGGSFAGVSLGMGTVEALEMTFKLNGFDPDMLSMFGLGKRGRQNFTAYGVIRDKRTSRAIEVKTIVNGRLIRIEGDTFERGSLLGHEYGIGEIFHYESHWDGREKYYFDFLNQSWRVDGVSQNDAERAILRIPGV